MTEIEIIHQRLKAPFKADEIEIKPSKITKAGTAKPLFFVSAHSVINRLDRVLGFENYSIEVSDLKMDLDKKLRDDDSEEGILVGCVVTIDVHHPLFRKRVSNVGERSMDEPNYNKVTTAYAQALKRAASLLGVGAYLYNLDVPELWPYDRVKKFGDRTAPPELVEQALKDVGFRFLCEETGERISWETAALSIHKFGRLLSRSAAMKYVEKPPSIETLPNTEPEQA